MLMRVACGLLQKQCFEGKKKRECVLKFRGYKAVMDTCAKKKNPPKTLAQILKPAYLSENCKFNHKTT